MQDMHETARFRQFGAPAVVFKGTGDNKGYSARVDAMFSVLTHREDEKAFGMSWGK